MTIEMTPDRGGWEIPADWRALFLEALAEYGNVSAAARHAGVSRNFVYSQRGTDEQFQAAWDDALKIGTEGLEDEARRRAFRGVEREQPHFYQGQLIHTTEITEYSDSLLTFLLRAHKPEKYRETVRQEHTGPNGDAIVLRFEEAVTKVYGRDEH